MTQRQHSVKCLHEESAPIAVKVKDRWMRCAILDQSSTHMEDNSPILFKAWVSYGWCCYGWYKPYDRPEKCMNYEMWNYFLNIAVVNS
jgi:hypothetical protein